MGMKFYNCFSSQESTHTFSLSDTSVLFCPHISIITIVGNSFSTLPIKDIAYGISKYFKGVIDLLEAINFFYCKSSVSHGVL